MLELRVNRSELLAGDGGWRERRLVYLRSVALFAAGLAVRWRLRKKGASGSAGEERK